MVPQVLAEFIQNSPGLFRDNVQISNAQIQVVNNGLQLSGRVNSNGREVGIENMRLIITADGQIAVEGRPDMNFDSLNALQQRVAPGMMNRIIRTFGDRINSGINMRIPQQWEVQGYQIHDEKLVMRMGRRQSRRQAA